MKQYIVSMYIHYYDLSNNKHGLFFAVLNQLLSQYRKHGKGSFNKKKVTIRPSSRHWCNCM